MAEKLEICCCGLTAWAKTIAWLDMTFASLGMILMLLVGFLEGQPLVHYIPPDVYDSTHRLLVFFVFSNSLCFYKGFTLLKGVNHENRSQLMTWTILTIIWLIVSIVYKLMTIKVIFVAAEIMGMFIVLGFNLFFIWIVLLYRIDIKLSYQVHQINV